MIGLSLSNGQMVEVAIPDPATAAPADVGTAAVGASTLYARADHVHGHGAQGGGTLHAAATTTTDGFMSAADKTKLNGVASGATANTAATAAPPAVAAASAVGTGTDYARADHTHSGVTSVNGSTGAVTVNAARARIGPPTLANATTATETIVAKWVIPANFLLAGDSIRAVVMHQSAGTGTLIYRLRIGALGTTADAVVATLTTSAAQVANAQGTANFTAHFASTTSVRGSGFAIQQAAALGTVTAANAAVTVVPTAAIHVSVTVTCSVAAANVTVGAWATVGD